MTDRDQQIATRAYRIWEDAGRPDGADIEHWNAAEAEIEGADGREDNAAPAEAPVLPAAREKAARGAKGKG